MTKKRIGAWISVILLLCFAGASADSEQAASWGQINQSIARGENWRRVVEDSSAFQLGKERPYEGDSALSVCAWGSYPSIDGSTVCVPMAMEFARQWLDLPEEDLNGFVNFSTTPYAYDRLFKGEANPMATILSRGVMMDDTHPIDLVLGTGPNEDERRQAEEAGLALELVPVCYDAFVFLVNGENPVENLSAEQIREIYMSRITDWSQVGGDAGEIAAYERPHGSGSQTAMDEMVMKDAEMGADVRSNFIADGMADLIEQIGNYDNAREAIGYSYLYYVDALYRSGDVKVISVDGVSPSPENLRSGAYPYTVCYYAVFRKGNENARRFADWIVSDEGQACVAQAGYVTLK